MARKLDFFLTHLPDNLKQVMQKIDQNGYGVALVVDENCFLHGIVTDGDIRRSILQGISLDTPINKIMNSAFVSVPLEYSPQQIIKLMCRKKNDYYHKHGKNG